jgi:hypothetical protein
MPRTGERREFVGARMTAAQREILRELAEQEGVGVSDLVRRAVDAYIAERAQEAS